MFSRRNFLSGLIALAASMPFLSRAQATALKSPKRVVNDGVLIPVLLAVDGGQDGDAKSARAATWTYTGTDLNGCCLFVSTGLTCDRPFSSRTVPGGRGTAYRIDGKWHIWTCDESYPLCTYAATPTAPAKLSL
jgi:hypothetical protein